MNDTESALLHFNRSYQYYLRTVMLALDDPTPENLEELRATTELLLVVPWMVDALAYSPNQ